MNRRHFLSAVTAAVGGFALDPELALWTPGQRTYFDIRLQRRTEPGVFEVVAEVKGITFNSSDFLANWKLNAPPTLFERSMLWREVR